MPIAFSCPHCGKHTTVADQYAGQSGPCAACGKTITIPVTTSGVSAPVVAVAAGGSIAAAAIIAIVAAVAGLVVCAGILAAVLLPAVQQTRSAAGRMQSANNMKQILLAIHTYSDRYKELPPAIVKDADGKPLYSGMVLLLPYLEQDQLYRRFDLSKPWNAPENSALSAMELPFLRNPSSPLVGQGTTDYLFVGGPQSLLDAPGQRTFANCPDGTSNTMVLVEVKGNTGSWAAPAVWTVDQPLDSDTVGAVQVGMADGSVRALPRTLPPQQIQKLANPRDGLPLEENLP